MLGKTDGDSYKALAKLIETMELPEGRSYDNLYDIRWLNRNIGFRNYNHTNYEEAVKLIARILQISN